MRRILLDCTHTYRTGAYTGIQRVVRQFAAYLPALATRSGYALVPVRIDRAGQLIPLTLEAGRVAFPQSASARESSASASAAHTLEMARSVLLPIARAIRATRLAQWLIAGPNENGLERLFNQLSRTATPEAIIDLDASDIFLSIDSSWVYDIRSALALAGRAGSTRVVLVCDILPLSNPQWFSQGTPRLFRGWLGSISSRVDGLVGISSATCDALRAYLAGQTSKQTINCYPVHLGADLQPIDESRIRKTFRYVFECSTRPRFITVGTLEPRKNVSFALDLFDLLLAQGCPVEWHIVGAEGWMAEQTVQRIRRHPAFGSRLHWWQDLNDHELSYCYQHATALVAVSKAEGFGLPLVEASLHGLPVFCSDIPVFREIMGSNACYLPLSDARLAGVMLQDFILRPEADHFAFGAPAAISHSWADAASNLLAACLKIHASRAGPPL